MKKLLILIGALLLIEIAIYGTLVHFRGARIKEYLHSQIVMNQNNLFASASAYGKIFDSIFNDEIDVDEVKSLMYKAIHDPGNIGRYRKQLRAYTQPVYDSLKSIGLAHLQYHFRDSTSFLRMHRPSFYGDSLKNFREGVNIANNYHKRVQGFENGRHLLAYRFVYPLDYKDEHIGSVELSIGLKQFINSMNRLYGIGYSYLLEKDKLFTNYTGKTMTEFEKYSITKNYFMEDCSACFRPGNRACLDGALLNRLITSSIKKRNTEKIRKYETFAEVMNTERGNLILTYVPIKDVKGDNLGYIISHSYVDDYIPILVFYRLLFMVLSLMAFVIATALFILYFSRKKARSMNIVLEKKVEEKVRELHEKEQFFAQQSKMVTMGEMLASILHQWKQPISTITLLTDLMQFECSKNDCDPELRDNITYIKEQALFMSQTGEDFRNFMKPSKGKSVFNVAEAVEEVIRLFEFSFTRYNTGFEKVWDEKTGSKAMIKGYPNEFKHVLLNFFNNSRDAIVEQREKLVEIGEDVSDFKGLITVSLCITDGNVVVKVSDTGGGVPEDIIDRIFDKDFSTKGRHGSGIGLYISSEMVKTSMNGTISVENTFEGAEFTLNFPLAE